MPLNGLFLVNKAKGIHKPAGWHHALSIRQTLDGPYADREVVESADGDWSYDYYQEGSDPHSRDNDFTNRALMQNMRDGIPIGVIKQVKKKPGSRYLVLGLASVEQWENGYFRLRRYAGQQGGGDFNDPLAPPLDLADARRRIERSIIARQGSGAFRAAVLEAFEGRCAISGYDVPEGLEAAHIVPYRGAHTNTVTNSLLLRADLHTLFDRGLIEIDSESFEIRLSGNLVNTAIGELHGRKVCLPNPAHRWTHALALRSKLPE